MMNTVYFIGSVREPSGQPPYFVIDVDSIGIDVFALLPAFDYHNGTVCFACAQHVAPDSCESIELCSQDRVSFSLLPFQK